MFLSKRIDVVPIFMILDYTGLDFNVDLLKLIFLFTLVFA